MGTVIRFPESGRAEAGVRLSDSKPESATIIILPVIRIERTPEEAPESESRSPRRRRRRRISRT